jgi:4-amino-4-deoxy-L-arabinose transferase-like glycosyltransferase
VPPRWWAALAGLTLLRLIVAAWTPLAPDEAYYWVWSKALAGGYFDHPPMVALWIRLGTLLAGDSALGLRLLGPLAAAGGSLLLIRAADDLFPAERPGLRAAILLNATLLFGIGAATMTPDTPLLFFWTLTLWALGRLVAEDDGRWWLVAGAAFGCAMASKYTAVLMAPGVLAWLLAVPGMRVWLRRWHLWAGIGVSVAVFSPVLAWNAGHGWISFVKQGGRVANWEPGRALQFLAELVAGQVAFATPGIALLAAAGIGMAARAALRRQPGRVLLTGLILIPAAVFAFAALGDRVQANWPSILYPPAAIAAALLAGRWRRLWAPSLALGLGITLLVWVQGIFTPLALPMRADPTLLRLGGWAELAADVETVRALEGAGYIVSDNYGIAALLAWLTPGEAPVLGLDPRWDLFNLPDGDPTAVGDAGIYIRSARREGGPNPRDWAEIREIGALDRSRRGMVAESFHLYRVRAVPDHATFALLPRRRQ